MSSLTIQIPGSPGGGPAEGFSPVLSGAMRSAAIRKQDVDKAANSVNRAIDLLMDLKQLPKVVAMLTDALQVKPKKVPWLAARAMAYRAMGLYAHALLDANGIVHLEPRLPNGYFVRSLLLARTGRAEAAMRDLNTAIELAPTMTPYHIYKGLLHMELGEFATAVPEFTSVVETGTERQAARARKGRALCYERLLRIEEAVADWTSLLKSETQLSEIYYRLSKLLYMQGHYLAASDAINQAARQAPNCAFPPARIFTLKAEIDLALGDAKAALRDSCIAVACLPSSYALPCWMTEMDTTGSDSNPAVTKRLGRPNAADGTLVTQDTAPAYHVRGLAKLACDAPALALPDLLYASTVLNAVCAKRKGKDAGKSKVARDTGSSMRSPTTKRGQSPTRASQQSRAAALVTNVDMETASAYVEQMITHFNALPPELSSAIGDDLNPRFSFALAALLHGAGPINLLSGENAGKLMEVPAGDTAYDAEACCIPQSTIHDDEEPVYDIEEEIKLVLSVTDGRIGRGRRRESILAMGSHASEQPLRSTTPTSADDVGFKPDFNPLVDTESAAALLCRRSCRSYIFRGMPGLIPALDYAHMLPFFRQKPATPASRTLRASQIITRSDSEGPKISLCPPAANCSINLGSEVIPAVAPVLRIPSNRELAMQFSRLSCSLAIAYLSMGCVERAALLAQHAVVGWPLNMEAHMVAAQVQLRQRDFAGATVSLHALCLVCKDRGLASKMTNAASLSTEARWLIGESGLLKSIPADLDRAPSRARVSSPDGREDDVFGDLHNQKRLCTVLWRDSDLTQSMIQPGLFGALSLPCFHVQEIADLDETQVRDFIVAKPKRQLQGDINAIYASTVTPLGLAAFYSAIAAGDDIQLSVRPRSEWPAAISRPAMHMEAGNIGVSLINIHRAMVHFSTAQYLEAQKCLEEAIDAHDTCYTRTYKATTELVLRNGKDALSDALKAVEHKPDSGVAWYYVGKSYELLNEHKEAADAFTRCFDLSQHPEPIVARAAAFARLRLFADATSDVTQALAVAPHDHRLWEEQGTVNASLREVDAAITSYDKALACADSTAEDKARICYLKGIVYANEDDWGRAIEQFDHALAILRGIQDDTNVQGACKRAVDELICYVRTSCDRDPVERQRQIMSATRRTNEEITFASATINVSAPSIEFAQLRYKIMHERAKTLQVAGRTQEALYALTFVIAQKKEHPEAIFRRAFCYKELQQYELAANDFETAKEQSDNPVFKVNYLGLATVRAVVTTAAGADVIEPIAGVPALSEYNDVIPPRQLLRMFVEFQLAQERKKKAAEDGDD